MSTIGNTNKFNLTNEGEIKRFLSGEDTDNQVKIMLKEFIRDLPKHLRQEVEGKRVGLELVIELKRQKAFRFFIKGESNELKDAFFQYYIVQY